MLGDYPVNIITKCVAAGRVVENRSLEVDSKLTDIGVLGFIFSSSINSPRFFGNAELSEHCDLESLMATYLG